MVAEQSKASMKPNGLKIGSLRISYRGAIALDGVSLDVPRGTAWAVLGANGAGKSTLLRAAAGLLKPEFGQIEWAGRNIVGAATSLARDGVRLVPESGNIFPQLSVRDNLFSGDPNLKSQARRSRLDIIVDEFPLLAPLLARKAGNLSGGERQTLAVARALMADPELLLLDEPSLGLSPKVAASLLSGLGRRVAMGKMTLLLAEQNATLALGVCTAGCILEVGRIRAVGSADLIRSRL